MNSKKLTQRTANLLTAAAVLFGAALIALLLLSLTTFPLSSAIGPFRQGVMIALVYALLMTLDYRWYGFTRNYAVSWALMVLGGSYFVILAALSFRFPNRLILNQIGGYSFLALIALLTGLLLRLNALSGGKFSAAIGLSERFANFLTFAFILISLIPVLDSGFYWDDAFFSVQLPVLRMEGASILTRTWDEIALYVLRGRINPFATFQFIFFYFLTDARVYKTFLILLTVLSCVSFWLLAKKLYGTARLTKLILLALPLCFQLRIYHDPLVSYYGLMQMLAIEFCWALSLFLTYLREGRKGALIGSAALFMIGLLTYEMFYPLLAVLILAAWHERKSFRGALKASAVHIAAALLLLGLTVALRLAAADSAPAYSGTALSLDLMKFFSAWLGQMSAAFPFSYRLSAPESAILNRLVLPREIFKTTFSTFIAGIEWVDIIALIILFVVLSDLRRFIDAKKIKPFHLIFGFALLGASSLVIALSAKYQEEICAGVGYLPVFFGYFAAAWLIFIAVVWLYPTLKTRLGQTAPFLLVYSVFAILFCMNQQSNRAVVRVLNEEFLFPRKAAESALQAGILDPISDNDLLISNQGQVLWETGWNGEVDVSDFYSLYGGNAVTALDAKTYLAAGNAEKLLSDETANAYVIEYAGNGESGFVKFGKLLEWEDAQSPGARLANPVVNSVYVFVCGFDPNADAISYVGWNGMGHTLPIREAWLMRTTGCGRLYKIDDPKSILFDTIGLTSFR